MKKENKPEKTKPFGPGFTESEEVTLESGRVVTRSHKVNPDVQDMIVRIKEEGVEFPSHAWPGGYPIFYVTKDNGVLCPDCCNKHREQCLDFENNDGGFSVVAGDVNYEDPNLFCWHCNKRVEAAYI